MLSCWLYPGIDGFKKTLK